MPWPFEREYMQLALAAGLVVGTCAPLVGTFLVQRHQSLMGDAVGHVAFAGVAAGLLLDVWPVWTALLAAGIAAVGVEILRARGGATADLALALCFYGGIAAGAVLAGRAGSGAASIVSYLFGSLLTVSGADVVTIAVLGLAIVAVIAATGRALFAVVLEEDSARVAGLPVSTLNLLLSGLTAVTIVAAMRVVGILLVAAMMVLPVASTRLVARSFLGTLLGAAAVGAVSVVLGLTAARAWALAPGGTIVCTATAVFLVTSVATGLLRRTASRA